MTPQGATTSRWVGAAGRWLAPLLDGRIAWPLGAVAAIVLVYGSLEPALAPPGMFELDKLIHLSAYGGLATLGCLPCDRTRHCAPIVVGLIALGGLIEIAQCYVPGRVGSIADFVANGCGVLLGVALSRWLRPVLAAWRKPGLAG
jgi:VanZ family protein